MLRAVLVVAFALGAIAASGVSTAVYAEGGHIDRNVARHDFDGGNGGDGSNG
jgi:hypothetical protein